MRPRYRVWDKEEKKMIYDAENTYDSYDGASFLITAEGRYAEYLNNVCDLEVLGNTHQNKELLDD